MNRATSATGWVRNPDGTMGWTWNPITGCLNGCEYCYARKLANTRLRERYLVNENIATVFAEGGEPYHKADKVIARTDPFYPRFWPERIAKLFDGGKKAKGIFVCDMGELFGDWVPNKWQEMIFTVIKVYPEHRFYLLTKQPQNLPLWSPFPDNCWVGVSSEGGFNRTADAFGHLNFVKAGKKFLSFEPLLYENKVSDLDRQFKNDIDWVIIGAQTKPYKPPKIEWVQEIVEACDKASIPVFLKDNLFNLLPLDTGIFYQPVEDGDHYQLRQEVPERVNG